MHLVVAKYSTVKILGNEFAFPFLDLLVFLNLLNNPKLKRFSTILVPIFSQQYIWMFS